MDRGASRAMYMLNLSLAGLLFLGVPSLANEETTPQFAMTYGRMPPTSQTALSACLGANVTFPWFHASTTPLPDDGELGLGADKANFPILIWRRERAPVAVLGSYSSAHQRFLASQAYGHRVDLSPDTRGMVLRGLTLADSATYSLLATDEDGVTIAVLQELTLTVEGLASSDGEVHVQMTETALWDSHAGHWRVSLTCGNFSLRALPPSFDVVWTTPTGVDLPSSNFSDGQFYLTLNPPILGGRYSCRVPRELFANACIPSGGGGPQGDGKAESGVWVEEAVARLRMLTAAHSGLAAENAALREQQTRLRERLEAGEQRRRNESSRWEEELTRVREEAGRQKDETNALREQMRQMRAEVNGVKSAHARDTTDLSHKMNGWVSQFNGKINTLATNVAFTAKVRRKSSLRAYQRLRFEEVHYNQGGAYSSATGAFTAPLSGTYLFFLRTESFIDEAVSLRMMKEGSRIMYLFGQDPKAYLTPAGSTVTHLNQGERVWVDIDWKDSTVSVWTAFGGFLVRPDVRG